MKTNKIYANDNIILFSVGNNIFLFYSSCQTCEIKDLSKYEEITNKAIIKTLIKSHNKNIYKVIEEMFLNNKNEVNESLIDALTNAKLEFDE